MGRTSVAGRRRGDESFATGWTARVGAGLAAGCAVGVTFCVGSRVIVRAAAPALLSGVFTEVAVVACGMGARSVATAEVVRAVRALRRRMAPAPPMPGVPELRMAGHVSHTPGLPGDCVATVSCVPVPVPAFTPRPSPTPVLFRPDGWPVSEVPVPGAAVPRPSPTPTRDPGVVGWVVEDPPPEPVVGVNGVVDVGVAPVVAGVAAPLPPSETALPDPRGCAVFCVRVVWPAGAIPLPTEVEAVASRGFAPRPPAVVVPAPPRGGESTVAPLDATAVSEMEVAVLPCCAAGSITIAAVSVVRGAGPEQATMNATVVQP